MDSDEYKLLRRWIASGIPVGEATEPVVKRIQIVPEQRVLSRDSTQQFAVLAHYTNGRIEDITRRAQYESNETTIATVDPAGLVATHKIPGEAAIMARYQEYVTVFRATVPRSETPVDFTFPQQTLVDKHTAAKWKSLALTPSALSTDEQFLRRVSIDLTGTLPDPKRVSEFLADTRPNKRQVIVDELLDSAEFGYLFASKWADILRVKRSGDTNRAQGTFSFHGWIRQAMQDDMPFDQFSRAVISATGDEKSNPRPSGPNPLPSRNSLWTTRPRCFWANASPARNATTILMKSGHRTIIGAWRRFWSHWSQGNYPARGISGPARKNHLGRNQPQRERGQQTDQ